MHRTLRVLRTPALALLPLLLTACASEASQGAPEAQVSTQAADVEPVEAAAPEVAQPDSVPILSGDAFRMGGAVTPGRYSCRDIPREQLNSIGSGGAPSTVQSGNEFEIRSATGYAMIYGGPQPGEYGYDAKAARITFTSGPYASEPGEESTIHAYYGSRKDSGLPVIVLIFRDPSYGETYEYCVKVER